MGVFELLLSSGFQMAKRKRVRSLAITLSRTMIGLTTIIMN